MRASLPVSLALLVFAPAAFAADYVDDPLTASTFTGRGSKGGEFSSAGWKVTRGDDSVWYEIPDALASGSVEYDAMGFSVGGTLAGTDHDILCVYQAPTGAPEPIVYSPDFRNNDFKVFTRIFGTNEPGRGGAMKVELHICPRGAPWHHDTACDPSCYQGGLAYANGMDKDVGWDATKWYRLGINWGSGKMNMVRDGVTLSTVTFGGTYSPKPMRVRLGSPRHADGSDMRMPIGLTFRNVKVSGTAGTMTPVCGAIVPPDTGVVEDTAEATRTTTLDVLQDVTAFNGIAGVFPDVTDLVVSGGPTEVVYLRFPAPSGVVKRAVLRMTTSSSASAEGGSGAVHAVSDTTWSETTLTWSTKPAWDSVGHGSPKMVAPNEAMEWDVTALVAKGTVNFAIVSTVDNGAHYLSKEADAAKGPKLVVESTPASGDAGVDAPPITTEDASTAFDAARPDGTSNDLLDDGGDLEGACSCRTPGPSRAGGAWVSVLFAVWVASTRRRFVGTRKCPTLSVSRGRRGPPRSAVEHADA